MSTTPRQPQKNKSSAARRAGASKAAARRYPLMPLLIGGIVVLGIVAIIAVALSGGNDDTDNGIAQTRPVTVEDKALPPYDSATATDPAVGEAAPTLIGQNFAGQPVKITDDGRAKVLVFVAHWCPHCQREVPIISQYLKDPGLPRGVDLYFVPTSTNPNYPNYPPQAWLEREGVGNVPTLVDDGDGTAHAAYGDGGFPYLVLVGKDGKVAARFAGELGAAAYPTLLDALAKGEPIPGTQQGGASNNAPS
jgi:cytochrome c biogenesis protein CcmG, thiol:disulfide interchange protein DsbE